jgi:DNA primase
MSQSISPALGKVGQALNFRANVGEYVEVADNDRYSFGNGTSDTPFALSAWIYYGGIDAAFTGWPIISKWNNTSPAIAEWGFYVSGTNVVGSGSSGGLTLQINSGGGVANRFVVEGQMDLCMSYQAGIKQTVAVSGTAFTDEHIHLIKRFCDTVILSFDTDQAGQSALKKTAMLCLLGGLDVYVVDAIGTKDPADLIKDDPSKWITAVEKKKHVVEALLSSLLATVVDERERGRRIVLDVLPFVKAIQSPIDRAHFINLISQRTGLPQQVLTEELAKGILPVQEVVQEIVAGTPLSPKERLEKEIIACATLFGKLEDEEFLSLQIDSGQFPDAIINEEMFELEKKIIADKETYFNDLMNSHKKEQHKAHLMMLQRKLKEDGANVEAILKEIYEHAKKAID